MCVCDEREIYSFFRVEHLLVSVLICRDRYSDKESGDTRQKSEAYTVGYILFVCVRFCAAW